ncbi:MAG: hypothetical protein CMJ86_01455 [Planctomycetes bacterium]|nr:hypothetical protein [Planctomycetota bacterium]
MRTVLALLLVAAMGLGLFFFGQRLLTDLKAGISELQPEPEPKPLVLSPGQDPIPAQGDESDPAPDSKRSQILDWNQQALDALERGEIPRAIELLQRCVLEDPGDRVLARNLALAQVRQAGLMIDSADGEQRREALAMVEHVLEALEGDERDAVAARIERWRDRAEHEAAFLSSGNQRFELSYDGEQAGLRAAEMDLLRRLDRAYQEFGERIGSFPLEGKRLRVVLYSPEAFTRLTGLGHWAGGAFDGTIRVPIQSGGIDARLDGVLRHELSHAFVDRLGGGTTPAWLNEGLAQYLESRQLDRLRLKAVRAACRDSAWPELASLRGNFSALGNEDAIRRAYGIAFGFIAYLAQNYGEDLVLDLMRAGAKGVSAESVFSQQIGFDLNVAWEDLRQEWQGQ